MACLNTNTLEYRTLQQRSGIPELDLYSFCNDFVEKHGRFPHLDEVPRADSSAKVVENLGLNKQSATDVDSLLTYTGTASVEEAVIALNNTHRDLESTAMKMGDRVVVTTERRPSVYEQKEGFSNTVDQDVNRTALSSIITKLSSLYGVPVSMVHIADITGRPEFEAVTDAAHTNAFIMNNHIFVNMDVARPDAPIHEFSHLMLGSLAVTDPRLFSELVSTVEAWPGYEEAAAQFMNRTREDVNEEVFVTELSKYVANKPSMLDSAPEAIKYELGYNITRVLDSMLMGDVSVRLADNGRLGSMKLTELAQFVNSDAFTNHFHGSLTDASVHRMLNNKKSKLMEKGLLKEHCD